MPTLQAHRWLRSSLFELVHEEIAAIDEVRVVCNSDLDPRDIGVAQHPAAGHGVEREVERKATRPIFSWAESYKRLHELLLQPGNLKVRVVARDTNPSCTANRCNRKSQRTEDLRFSAVATTRQGGATTTSCYGRTLPRCSRLGRGRVRVFVGAGCVLPDAIIEEIERCSRRTEFQRVEDCPEQKVAAAMAMAEAPIYRRGRSLMPLATVLCQHVLRPQADVQRRTASARR